MKRHGWALIFVLAGVLLSACTGALKWTGGDLLVLTSSSPAGTDSDPVSSEVKLAGRCHPLYKIDVSVAGPNQTVETTSQVCKQNGTFAFSIFLNDEGGDGLRDYTISQTDNSGQTIQVHRSVRLQYCTAALAADALPSGDGSAANPFRICASKQMAIYGTSQTRSRTPAGNVEYVRLKADLDLDDGALTEPRESVVYQTDNPGFWTHVNADYFNREVHFDGEGRRIHSQHARPLFHRFYSGEVHDVVIDTDSSQLGAEILPYLDTSCLINTINPENPIIPTRAQSVEIYNIQIANCKLLNANTIVHDPRPVNGRDSGGTGALVGYIQTPLNFALNFNIHGVKIGNIEFLNTHTGFGTGVGQSSAMGSLVGGALFQGSGAFNISTISALHVDSKVTEYNLNSLSDFGNSTGGLIGDFFTAATHSAPQFTFAFSITNILPIEVEITSNVFIGGVVGRLALWNLDTLSSAAISQIALTLNVLNRDRGNTAFNGGLFGQFTFNDSFHFNPSAPKIDINQAYIKMNRHYSSPATQLFATGGIFGSSEYVGDISISDSSFDVTIEPVGTATLVPLTSPWTGDPLISGAYAGEYYQLDGAVTNVTDVAIRLQINPNGVPAVDPSGVPPVNPYTDAHDGAGILMGSRDQSGSDTMNFKNGFAWLEIKGNTGDITDFPPRSSVPCTLCVANFTNFIGFYPKDFTYRATEGLQAFPHDQLINNPGFTLTDLWTTDGIGRPRLKANPFPYDAP